MGRKPKAEHERFTTISIRVTPEDHDLIVEAAKLQRHSGTATYCRQVLVKDASKVVKKAA